MNKTVKMAFAGNVALDANVQIAARHCNECARGVDEKGKRYCSQFGTFHGEVKQVFQENRLFTFLMKKGIVSPHFPKVPLLLGYWANEKDTRNLITNTGRAAAASRLNGAGSEALFSPIGQGIGTTAAAATDTTLETERTAAGGAASGVHALPGASVTASRVTTTVTNDTAQLVGSIAEAATMAITESGLFNADTNGVMLARQVFAAINVVSGDSLQFTWKIKAA